MEEKEVKVQGGEKEKGVFGLGRSVLTGLKDRAITRQVAAQTGSDANLQPQ